MHSSLQMHTRTLSLPRSLSGQAHCVLCFHVRSFQVSTPTIVTPVAAPSRGHLPAPLSQVTYRQASEALHVQLQTTTGSKYHNRANIATK